MRLLTWPFTVLLMLSLGFAVMVAFQMVGTAPASAKLKAECRTAHEPVTRAACANVGL